MRSIEFLRKKFEFAIQYKKPIYITNTEIDALNDIINFVNTKEVNTELEDALLLFYIKCYWHIDNDKGNIILQEKSEKQFPFNISNADTILNKICSMVRPKERVKESIAIELKAHQVLNKVPEEEQITHKQVSELVDEVLLFAKTRFPLIKTMMESKLNSYCKPHIKTIERLNNIW